MLHAFKQLHVAILSRRADCNVDLVEQSLLHSFTGYRRWTNYLNRKQAIIFYRAHRISKDLVGYCLPLGLPFSAFAAASACTECRLSDFCRYGAHPGPRTIKLPSGSRFLDWEHIEGTMA